MTIPYEIEQLTYDGKPDGFIFRFSSELSLLEDFMYGEVPSFGEVILFLLNEVLLEGVKEQSFTGNLFTLDIKPEYTLIECLFSEDQEALSVATADLAELLQQYLMEDAKLKNT